MNRGACRRDVFLTKRDGVLFETLIGEWSVRAGVEVHAYCLMSNHFHLLIRSVDGRMSAFMQQVQAAYTKGFNQQRGGDGAIFRGRFHSIHVDTDAYLTVVSRYIHRNPVDVRPSVPLDEYRWSSCRYYAGRALAPGWLHTERLVPSAASTVPAAKMDALTIRHLVSVVTDELRLDDEAPISSRTVAFAVLDALTDEAGEALIAQLEVTSAAALRTARSRARARRRDDPRVDEAVEHVLRRFARSNDHAVPNGAGVTNGVRHRS